MLDQVCAPRSHQHDDAPCVERLQLGRGVGRQSLDAHAILLGPVQRQRIMAPAVVHDEEDGLRGYLANLRDKHLGGVHAHVRITTHGVGCDARCEWMMHRRVPEWEAATRTSMSHVLNTFASHHALAWAM